MAINPNTNFTAGQVLTADQTNRFPRGIVGFNSDTSTQGPFPNTYTDVAGTSVTFTAVANRYYKVSFIGSYYSNAAGNLPAVRILDGAAQVAEWQFYTAQTSAYSTVIFAERLLTFTAGPHTVKAQLKFFTGGGSGALQGSITPTSLWIEDVGPA